MINPASFITLSSSGNEKDPNLEGLRAAKLCLLPTVRPNFKRSGGLAMRLRSCVRTVLFPLPVLLICPAHAQTWDVSSWRIDAPATPEPQRQSSASGPSALGASLSLDSFPLGQSPHGLAAQALAPSVMVPLGGGANITLEPNSVQFRQQGERQRLELNIGAGYLKQQEGRSSSISARGGFKVGSNAALGGGLSISKAWNEAIISGAYHTPEYPLLFSASVAYAWGKPEYDVGSVGLQASLRQYGYVLGGSYAPEFGDAEALGAQSVGLRMWGAQAHASDNVLAAPTTALGEFDDVFVITRRHYQLALGRLRGFNVSTQWALTDRLVMEVGLGGERVSYALASGAQDDNATPYRSMRVWYDLNASYPALIGLNYKEGAAERGFALTLDLPRFRLNLFKRHGVGGTQGDAGVMAEWKVPFGKALVTTPAQSLARRMRPMAGGSDGLLQSVSERPPELPRVFLAKVDRSADSELRILKPCLSPGVTVESQQISIPVGPNVNITSATKNGDVFAVDGVISTSGDRVVIHLGEQLATQTEDTYVLSASDSDGATYRVHFTVTANDSGQCTSVGNH